MNTFDKILHIVGLAAGGIVAVGASGGVAMPAWLIVVAGVVAPIASGAAAVPQFKKKLTAGPGQAVDEENPKP